MKASKAITIIAQSFAARERAYASNNQDWFARHTDTIAQICDEVFPHGSGLNGGKIMLDLDRSKPNRLVFVNLDFQHMDDGGSYDGWSSHEAIVTASLECGYDIRITGEDRNDIKDDLAQIMSDALDTAIYYSTIEARWIDERWIGLALENFAHNIRHPKSNRDASRLYCGQCC